MTAEALEAAKQAADATGRAGEALLFRWFAPRSLRDASSQTKKGAAKAPPEKHLGIQFSTSEELIPAARVRELRGIGEQRTPRRTAACVIPTPVAWALDGHPSFASCASAEAGSRDCELGMPSSLP
jgi:hypothetical protein